MNIARIKNEENLFRDMSSNAIIVRNSDDSVEKKRLFFNRQIEDINNLKKEVSEIKETMSKILELLSNRENR